MQWVCECGFKNKPQNEVCGGNGPMGCKSPKPVAAGPWICHCGFKNKVQNEQCGGNGPMGCNAPKPDGGMGAYVAAATPATHRSAITAYIPAAAPPVRASPYGFGPKGGAPAGGKWDCVSCGFNNKDTNEVCGGNGPMGCKAPKPAAVKDPWAAMGGKGGGYGPMGGKAWGGPGKGYAKFQSSPDGSWACASCGFNNKPVNEVCGGNGPMGCKMPPMPVMPAMPAWGNPYACGKGMMAAAFDGGKGMMTAFDGGKGRGKEKKGPEWVCVECNFKNKMANEVCGGANGKLGCKKPRGDWVCDCGFTNRPQNTQCGGTGPAGCNAPRPEGAE